MLGDRQKLVQVAQPSMQRLLYERPLSNCETECKRLTRASTRTGIPLRSIPAGDARQLYSIRAGKTYKYFQLILSYENYKKRV